MGYIKQLAGQTMVYGIGIVVPRLLNVVLLTPFYTRIFSPGEYGVVTELYAYIVFLLVILTYGMETGFFRFADKHHNKDNVYKTALLSLFSTTVIFLILVFVFVNLISSGIGYDDHPEYIKWIAIIVAIDAFTSMPFAKLRLENKVFIYTAVRIVEVSVNIFLNWYLLYYAPAHYENSSFIAGFYNPEIGVGYVFVSNLVASCTKLIILLPYTFVFKGIFDFKLLKSILLYSYPLLIAGLAGTINEALDRILIKYLIPENSMSTLGVYGANYKLAVVMTLFIQMFRYAAEPFFLNKKDESNATTVYAVVMEYFIFFCMLIFMLVMLFLPFFSMFIGSNFREGIAIVPIILMANVFMGIFYNLSIWYKVSGQTRFGAWFVIIGALITIFINVSFLPTFGYIASAWGHFFSYLCMIILCYFYGQKYLRIPYNIKKISIYFFVPLGLIAIKVLLYNKESVSGIFISSLLIILYLALFIRLQGIKFQHIWK